MAQAKHNNVKLFSRTPSSPQHHEMNTNFKPYNWT